MGNVLAAGPPNVAAPPLFSPPPTSAPQSSAQPGQTPPQQPPGPPEETGPGTFEDLHKKCKDIFPAPFEGAKLMVNKGLSNHFQISHSMTMSMLQPSGYKFGCTYVGTKQFGPMESYPIMMGELDPSGNLNANIIHQLSKNIRCKFVSQIQNNKWLATQLSGDYKTDNYTASATIGNPDILNGSGVCVAHYLQKVTERIALGAELLYQCGSSIPGNEFAIYTVAGRYASDKWQVSSSFTPFAGGFNTCYYHRCNENLQMGVELEGSLRNRECTGTIGYQLELPTANLTFRGQVDSNWCVGAVLEKKLPPLPFTFALSAFSNHVKGAYRFGIGLIVG